LGSVQNLGLAIPAAADGIVVCSLAPDYAVPRKTLNKALGFVMGEGGSLRSRVIRSGIWMSIAEASITVLALVKSIILARLLSPDMFGLMGLCGIVIRTIETFTRPGIGPALIQRQASFDEARDTAFTILFARGLLLAVVLVLVAPAAAWFYDTQELEPLLQVLSLVFIIGGVLNVNTIARQKELEFRRLAFLRQTTAFLGVIVTVAAAFWLRNVWALIIGQVATTAFNTLLSYYFVPGRPRFSFNLKIAKELLSYGKFITASSVVLFIVSSLDSAVIGKIHGTEELGYYVLAFTVANLVTASPAKLASGIMMPAYSKLQSDLPALRRAYLRTISLLMLFTLPAALGMITIAEELILAVYGPKWENAVLPLQILAIFGVIRSASSINGYLFEGIGKPRLNLYIASLRLAVLVPTLVGLTLYYGLLGAAVAVTIAMTTQWVLSILYTWRNIGVTLGDTARIILQPLWKSSVMALGVLLIGLHVDSTTISGLAIVIAFGATIYAALNITVIMDLRRGHLR
jgi:O-antigen/teichoic acid export membrane protein